MNTILRQHLSEQFEQGKRFLLSQEALLLELAETFETELWDCLDQQATFKGNSRVVLPANPPVKKILYRQILFAWGLGYAVGAAATKHDRSRQSGELDQPSQ
ncbi:MAG TPA: hypothetical protein GX693_03145 [Firmicutes bacterium]|nr:hypothetical protein [Bacillota bacterium]